MNSATLRQAFLDFFVQKGHTVVESSRLVPVNDATLLFTNAGMVQFKDVFLGQDKRAYTRAVSAQRCLRAGGKHNDLDNVGYTARHHTFFEMLGNFSFGDYFKREAIHYAWEFLTQVLGIPAQRLWVTVYLDDDEAANIWLNDVGVAPDRISRCGDKDNFWSMGDTGPCGPCSEIFYDHGPEIAGGPPGSPDADGDRYIEIWNLVFMQFNRDKDGRLHPLPRPSVDTGMGLERIAAVIQGVHNNYHIDTFQYLIDHITTLRPGLDRDHPSLKVLADHIRACAFLLADGVTPSNEGRGYVLRRIIRRAVRHGYGLKLPLPFFHRLVAPLCAVMGKAYPELIAQQSVIEQRLEQEEQQFSKTLEQGLHLLHEHLQQSNHQDITGEVAFKLYDTYGFPLDLTTDIARELGLSVDIAAFNDCMQQQRMQSQIASQFEQNYHTIPFEVSATEFQGYDAHEAASVLQAILNAGQWVDDIQAGDEAALVLNVTPFYAEAGGQVGDTGVIVAQDAVFRVKKTQYQGSTILHIGQLEQGHLHLQQAVHAEIDEVRRDAIRLNHSATHLLHAALRQLLGAHVQQKGSLVEADRARFDFTHPSPLRPEDLSQLDAIVNQEIRANHCVETNIMPIEEAKKTGAAALFDEKYGDKVRVLSMGEFSKELCGGTHARRTGDIGLFKITAEYGIASGVRRIEFVTGAAAIDWLQQQLGQLNAIAAQLKTQPDNVLEKIELNLQTLKQQEKDLRLYKQSNLKQESALLRQHAEIHKNKAIVIQQLNHLDIESLRMVLDQLKSAMDNAVIVLFSVSEGRLSVVAGVSKDLIGHVPAAGVLVKQLCGKGGGRDDMAQGGGPVPDDLNHRLAELKQLILQA